MEKTFEELRNESVKILGHETFIDYFNDLQGNADFYIEERINKICDHVMQQVREATIAEVLTLCDENFFSKEPKGKLMENIENIQTDRIKINLNKMKTGIELIAEERQRQIEKEGWTPEHDDQHNTGDLAHAAAAYASAELYRRTASEGYDNTPHIWPFERKWWKPTPDDRIRELQKAGALIAAEIDRLQRL